MRLGRSPKRNMSATPQELRLPDAVSSNDYWLSTTSMPENVALQIGASLGLQPASQSTVMLGFCQAIEWLSQEHPIPGVSRDLERLRFGLLLARTSLPASAIEVAGDANLTLIGLGIGYTRAQTVSDSDFRSVLSYTLAMAAYVRFEAQPPPPSTGAQEPGSPTVFPIATPRVLWTGHVHVSSHDPQLITQSCGVAFDTVPHERRYRWVFPHRLSEPAVIGALRSERLAHHRFGPLRADQEAAVFQIPGPMQVVFVATGRVA